MRFLESHGLFTTTSTWVWFSLQNWYLYICNFFSIFRLDARFILIYLTNFLKQALYIGEALSVMGFVEM